MVEVGEYIAELDTKQLEAELEFVVTKCFFGGLRGQLSVVNNHMHFFFNPPDEKFVKFMEDNNIENHTHEEYRDKSYKILEHLVKAYEDMPLPKQKIGENPTLTPFYFARKIIKILPQFAKDVFESDVYDPLAEKVYKKLVHLISDYGERIHENVCLLQQAVKDKTGKIPEHKCAANLRFNGYEARSNHVGLL